MSALEDLMRDITKNAERLARHKFSKRNHDVTSHLLHLPTTTVLQRDALPEESRLFTISSNEVQTHFHDDLIKKMQEIKNGTAGKDVSQLLSVAGDLNKLSNDASVEKRITRIKQQYDEYQAILDHEVTATGQNKDGQEYEFIIKDALMEKEQQLIHMESICTAKENTLNERRSKLEYAKALIKEKQRLLNHAERQQQMNIQSLGKTNDPTSEYLQSDKQNVAGSHPLLKKIEELKKMIAIEKAKLNSGSSLSTSQLPLSVSTSESASTSTSAPTLTTVSVSAPSPIFPSALSSRSGQPISDLLQILKSNNTQRTNIPDNQNNGSSSKEIISVMDQIIQMLQKMAVRSGRRQELEDELDKMNHFRQQIVTKTDQEIQDEINKLKQGDQNAGHDILMAMVLIILHEHDGRILYDDLKTKITDYATHLGLDSSKGLDAIYSWIGKEVFSIDRSQIDSVVVSNWK